MRFLTYRRRSDDVNRLGILLNERVLDVETLDTGIASDRALTMQDLIQHGSMGHLRALSVSPSEAGLPLGDVLLCAPIPFPRFNPICLGRNYAEHAAEQARAYGEDVAPPTFFTKAVTTVTGPYDDIPFPAQVSEQIDWEVELAAVIGRQARKVAREEALEYVFGYTVLNDVTARDLQRDFGGQYFYGKSLDGFCPMGPWIVTADEIPDPQKLTLRLRVNGQLKQEASTTDMIHSLAETLEILTRAITLLPGQIIATGTPAGVGNARTPPEYLRPGDVVESEIEGIGMMRNTVSAPGQTPSRSVGRA